MGSSVFSGTHLGEADPTVRLDCSGGPSCAAEVGGEQDTKQYWIDCYKGLRAKWEELEAETIADTIERCEKAVWDAGGDNVEFHCAAIRALKDF